MRRFSFLSLIFIFLCIISSCQKDSIEASTDNIVLDNTQTPFELGIVSNTTWTITHNDTWYSITPTTGSGSATIMITPTINSFGSERTSSLAITGGKKGDVALAIPVSQKTVSTTFKPDTIFMTRAGGTATFEVSSNAKWETFTDGQYDWITSYSPKTGTGNATISVTIAASTSRRKQSGCISFRTGSYISSEVLVLAPIDNQGPRKPVLKSPADNATGVPVAPTLSWSCSDPDGDELSYTVCYSLNNTDWTTAIVTDSTYKIENNLQSTTKYYWKIIADDNNGRENSKVESDVFSFTTSAKTSWEDGEVWRYIKSSKSTPVKLIVVGDGFIKDDFAYNGNFQKVAEKGITGLFSIEPYKTYKEYFDIYFIAAFSSERGMTITGTQSRNTKFKVTKADNTGSTSISCNYDAVFNWVKTKMSLNDSDLENTSIILISNEDIYAGTCWMWPSGRSIGIAPLSTKSYSGIFADYQSIVMHECGGHGFGRLCDEYINYDGYTIPETGDWSKQSIREWQAGGGMLNVSITNVEADMPWAGLIGKSGYERITNPQGGCYYSLGVWRSEVTSCMINNMHYYSAAQRLQIVKRILTVSGEGFTIEKFIQNDTQKSPSSAQMSMMLLFDPENFIPLAPPVLMKD